SKLKGKTLFKYLPFSEAMIHQCFGEQVPQPHLRSLFLFSEEKIIKERTKLKRNHAALRLSGNSNTYIKKHIASYFYKSFARMIPALQYLKTEHKKFTPQRRYIQLPAEFVPSSFPKLSFTLEGKKAELTLKTSFYIGNQKFADTEVKRIQFIFRHQYRLYK